MKKWQFVGLVLMMAVRAEASDPGVAALQSRDWSAAERIYRERLAAAPDATQDRINLGIALFGLGKIEAATQEFSTAAAQPRRGFSNTPALANVWLARARVRLKDEEGALRALEAASRAGLRATSLLKVAPDLSVLADTARFKAVMAEVRARELPCEAAGPRAQWVLAPGRWEQRDLPGQLLGYSTIAVEAGGCAFVEKTENSGGYTAHALHAFQPATSKWHQLYADSAGVITIWEGTKDENALIYERSESNGSGTPIRERQVWTQFGAGRVGQRILRTGDNGKTWNLVWEGVYVRPGDTQPSAMD